MRSPLRGAFFWPPAAAAGEGVGAPRVCRSAKSDRSCGISTLARRRPALQALLT